jgi:hypothetical protein
MKKGFDFWLLWVGWLLSGVLLMMLLSGCKSIRYVPVETVKTVEVNTEVLRRDSIYISDSVQVPYPYEVEKPVNYVSGFQHFQIYLGRIAALIVLT